MSGCLPHALRPDTPRIDSDYSIFTVNEKESVDAAAESLITARKMQILPTAVKQCKGGAFVSVERFVERSIVHRGLINKLGMLSGPPRISPAAVQL